MTESVITCPCCKNKFQLTEAMTQQIETRLRKELDREAKKKAEGVFLPKIKDLEEQLKEKSKLVAEASKQEIAFHKRIRELEDREKSQTLEIERALTKERNKIWEVQTQLQEQQQLKLAEKDLQLSALRKQIEELGRMAALGSQQAQGEILELELENLLSLNFKFDEFEPVEKGVKGADVIHKVRTKSGHYCGTILWETKRTKAWSDGWIPKLKLDQRRVKAELAVVVTASMPKKVERIGNIDGVWITDFPYVLAIGMALREILIEVTQARSALAGKANTREVIYNYLTGSEFKQRIEAFIEPVIAMRIDLVAEKNAIEKLWAKREKQIQRVEQSIAGMHGDLQGIIGAALPLIQLLELPVVTISASEDMTDEGS